MGFSSTYFLFVFLPITLLLYFIFRKNGWRNLILLVASVAFYAWAEPVDILVLLASLVVNWLAGWGINRYIRRSDVARAKPLLIAGLGFNLLLLIAFKYLRGVLLPILPQATLLQVNQYNLLTPLGISFFTFSAMSFLIDIYQEDAPFPRSVLHYANYILMFPKLLQGPIAQYSQVAGELAERSVALDDVAEGARRFIGGLAKKTLIADYLASVSAAVFGATTTIGADLAWFGLAAYTLQIYFDFAGYTDMAIGLGRMLGFHLPENFNSPYTSRSLSEFWRRWHMTLTGWLRLYVFLPLELQRRDHPYLRQEFNLLFIFLLTGIWHGATLNFAIWGLYNGLVLVIESGRFGKWLKRLPDPLRYAYTLFLIMLGWAFFRLDNFQRWVPFFKALFGLNGLTANATLISLDVLKFTPFLLAGTLVCVLAPRFAPHKAREGSWQSFALDMALVGVFCLSIAVMISRSFTPFIYFQF